MSKKILIAFLVLVAAVPVAACGGDEAGGSGDGDALVVYSGRNRDLVGPLLERYERESGQDLEIRYTDSADAAATLIEEGENSPADVFLSQDAGALGAVQREGLLADLPAPILDSVDARFRSREGRWVGVTGRARTIAYDRRELEPSDLPRSVLDVTDREWRGRVGFAPTNPSFESFITALRVLRGDDTARRFLEGLVANDARPYPNNIAVRDAIARGEVDVGLINHYYVAEARATEGDDYPVGLYFPPRGDPGSLINVSGAGILGSSERVDAARRFVRFLLSEQAQRFFADETKEYPLAAGVRPDPALRALDEIDAPDVDLADLDDLQGSVELIQESGALR